MKKKLTLAIILVLCLMVASVVQVNAEGIASYKISNLEISVMPEYDTSDVLVLNSITFTNNTAQPYNGEIRFPVPKGTTSNIVTETVNSSDNHVTVKVEDKGDYAEFVWKPLQPIKPNASYPVHLEYYYNPLTGTSAKSFAYQFNATVPVDQAKFYAYQPLKASDFKMEPVGQAFGPDQKGFQVYGLTSSNLKVGDRIDVKISYTKNDPNPSIQPQSPSSGNSESSGQTSKSQLRSVAILIPLVAIIIGIIVIGIKAFSRQGGEKQTSTDNLKHQNRREKASANSKLSDEKRKVRQMLLDGEIGEETYHELILELEREYS